MYFIGKMAILFLLRPTDCLSSIVSIFDFYVISSQEARKKENMEYMIFCVPQGDTIIRSSNTSRAPIHKLFGLRTSRKLKKIY